MKKIATFIIILFSIITSYAQVTHTLTAYDHYFDPDTLYIQPGDTVDFVSIGYHSATEIDSVDWENNSSNSNGGFWVGVGSSTSSSKFTVNTLGKYYFICDPHASMGMKGVLYVQNSTGINEKTIESNFSIIQLSENSFQANYSNCDEVNFFNLEGILLNSFILNKNLKSQILEINKNSKGLTIAVFKQKGEVKKSIKISF